MRISWFRAAADDAADSLDGTPALLRTIGHTHEVEIVTEADAHDFVWRQFRSPSDLCVYELGGGAQHRFIWPYLFHYPGILVLREPNLHDSRAASLEQDEQSSDYAIEFAFNHGHPPRRAGRLLPRGGWPMLRAPLLASRLAVVADAELALALQEEYPGARLRHVPPGIDAEATSGDARGSARTAGAATEPVRVAGFGKGKRDVIERAVARATQAGAHVALIDRVPAPDLADCDVVLAMTWPAAGESLTPALAGMAARKPVVTFEVEATAGWPALDPQTWRQRGTAEAAPIVVSVDPRDEEHSLMLAIRRLAADADLRASLSSAGHVWWRAHATLRHTTEAWLRVLDEARRLEPPPQPADWPPHLSADGTSRVRELLAEMGTSVDFLT